MALADFNRATFSGRVTRDPAYHTFEKGGVAKFSIAVNDYKGGAQFIDVDAYDKLGEIIRDYVHKGDLVLVSGQIQQREYEKDGQKRKSFSLRAYEFRNCSSKGQTQPAGDSDDIPF